jgi:pilus assembly protein FimV
VLAPELDEADLELEPELELEPVVDETDSIDLGHFSEEDFQLDSEEADLTSEKQDAVKLDDEDDSDELTDFDPSWDDVFETIDDAELPTFNEEDALNAIDGTEDEIEQPISEEKNPHSGQSKAVGDEPAGFWDELDEIFLDDELPLFDEEQALEEFSKDVDSKIESAESKVKEDKSAADNMASSEGEPLEIDADDQATDELKTAVSDREFLLARQEFDVGDLDDLLVDGGDVEPHFNFERPTAEAADSAGMDIGAMLDQGGEDWNGFKLTTEQKAAIPNDVPADEKAIWRPDIQTEEPELAEENWAAQDDLDNEISNPKQFLTVDELMAQADAYDEFDGEEDFKLDVGLDDFPDVIGKISAIDVDRDSEISGKLDLAKIYMEMNDDEGAVKLLEKVIVEGDDLLRREAKQLIDQIRRQR